MDAISYFFLNSGILLFVLALIFFILGFIFGRLTKTDNCEECEQKLNSARQQVRYLEHKLKSHESSVEPPPGAVRDEKLGIIYTETPDTADDLTEIVGVGEELSRRLNEFGVYTYRQIASWDRGNVREFGERIAFKDRVDRDNWIGQARKLHVEKYGEKL